MAFIKNAGLGFAIPYIHNGESYDYVPDFIVHLKSEPAIHVIVETKGFDDLGVSPSNRRDSHDARRCACR
jgi:type III restriction enzyme